MNEANVKSLSGSVLMRRRSGQGIIRRFTRCDAFRHRQEAHILKCLDRINFKDRRTLEIGLGRGSDAEQIIRRWARWSGVELTRESVERVAMRLALRRLPYERREQPSLLALPFEEGGFRRGLQSWSLAPYPGDWTGAGGHSQGPETRRPFGDDVVLKMVSELPCVHRDCPKARTLHARTGIEGKWNRSRPSGQCPRLYTLL